MSIENLATRKFRELMQDHISKIIEYMFDNNEEFGIACEINDVHFTPDLPIEIKESLPEITLFMLANYSFESASLDNEYLSFEAGFGNENFGSLVQVPLLSIKQLFVGEYPILMNIASYIEEPKKEATTEIDSMSALLNNPENAKLLKKR
ncbi:hypothetical protein MNB_SV-14-92 [hydrothermal vent metagenome]|uniref:Stringent starvation protein B n=1 Tax=hydrothermal vent metagenome TaxID=652676 RepID=A0A1W1BZ93_9ZZZZ